jgi:uncharacterized membrane protein
MSTAATSHRQRHRWPYIFRVMRARPRLFVSGGTGLVVIAVLFAVTDWRPSTRLLVGWDVGVALYLALAFELFARCDAQQIRRRALVQDDGRFAVLVLTVGAAVASLAAIFAELSSEGGAARPPSQLALAAVTVFVSWAFIHTMFALHYAHAFYADRGRPHHAHPDHAHPEHGHAEHGHAGPEHRGGMNFPDDDTPDYWDFAYVAFVIGMCAQVSDVTVSAKSARRTVLAHSVVSFVFNAALLALTVNIAASAL